MTGRTHAAAGAFLGALSGAVFSSPEAGAVTGAVAALLPDIDHPGSTIGRKIPVIPVILEATAGHRTVTHTLWFCFAVAAGFGFLANWLAGFGLPAGGFLLALPALAGSLSHLALDALTRSGVEPLAPLNGWHPRGRVVTGSFTDSFLVFLVFLGLTGGVLYLWGR
ncbi:MAG: metal-dependent hydrolase [Firmicutes bacterium]|nr:metal-dependent hydrolase [Bacillota bacterium]